MPHKSELTVMPKELIVMPRELILVPRELIVIPRELIVIQTANLYFPSYHFIIVWGAVICRNFCVILPTLMRGCHGENKSPPMMHLPLTSIRENALAT